MVYSMSAFRLKLKHLMPEAYVVVSVAVRKLPPGMYMPWCTCDKTSQTHYILDGTTDQPANPRQKRDQIQSGKFDFTNTLMIFNVFCIVVFTKTSETSSFCSWHKLFVKKGHLTMK